MTVTVVIPARDAAQTIERAVRSAKGQAPPPAKVVVVDDGSRDATGDLARRAGAEVVRLPASRGVSAARNAGLAAAGTGWAALLDADDWWLEGHLAALAPHRVPGTVLVASSALRVDDRGVVVGRHRLTAPRGPVDDALLTGELVLTTSAVAVDVETTRRLGGFDERFTVPSCEDWDLWVRLARHGRVVVLPAPTAAYQVDDGARTAERLDQRAADRRRALAERLADGPRAATVARRARAWLDLDLARTYLKHERRPDARRHARAAVRGRPGRPAAWGVLLLALLPPSAQRHARAARRRLARSAA